MWVDETKQNEVGVMSYQSLVLLGISLIMHVTEQVNERVGRCVLMKCIDELGLQLMITWEAKVAAVACMVKVVDYLKHREVVTVRGRVAFE